MQHSMSRAFNGGGPRFLLGKGGTRGRDPHVVFQEVADVLEPDVARGWVLALGAADLDGDLLPEIYVANDFGPDRLLHNRSTPGRLSFARLEGKKTLFIPNSKVIGRDSFKGMGVDFGDLAGRGRLDIYVSNIATEYALEESHFVWMNTGAVHRMRDGVAPFVDESESLGLSRSGWGWDARFGDFDNDSVLEALQATGFVRGSVNRWPELHELAMGNDELLRHPASWLRVQPGDDLSGYARSPFFVRSPRGRYVDVAPQVGLGEPDVRRGIATADIDGDGRLDLAIAAQWDTSYVYRNTSPATGAFLGLHLRLPVAGPPAPTRTRAGHPIAEERSRPAIGAAATITLPDGRRMTAQVDGGNGHSGKRSPDLHFGLGALPAGSRLRVELAWRDAAGAVHRQTMELPAGWHTVMLGGGA
jgi:hypothetical protein